MSTTKKPTKPVVPITPWDPAEGITSTTPQPNPLITPSAADYAKAKADRNAKPTPSPSAGPAVTTTSEQKESQRFQVAQQHYVNAYKAYIASVGGGHSTSQMVSAHEALIEAKKKFTWAHQHYANILGYDPTKPKPASGGKPATTPKPTSTPTPTSPPSGGGGTGSGGSGGGTGGGTGGTGGTGGAGGGNTYITYAGSPAPTATPEKAKSRVDWAEQYGVQAGMVDTVPELKTLFNNAVATKMSTADFTKKFQNTDWYKTHNDAWRVAYGTEKTDPASWKHEIALAGELVRSTATNTGVKLTDAQVAGLARQALYLSAGSSSRIDAGELKKHIVGTGIITGTTGEALTTIDDLKAHGADMGVQHDDLWYTNAAQNILHGDGNLNGWKKQINDVAKSKYAAFADQIDKGQTVRSLASPYINSMANLLEVPAANIDLTDNTINKALTNLNADSKPELQPLWQFETGLRKDPRWASTKNARDTVDSVTRKILSDFGLVS